jgi:hypothetical protein
LGTFVLRFTGKEPKAPAATPTTASK